MQAVSEAWKLNQQQDFIDESFLEISMDMSAAYALDNASASSNDADVMSQTVKVVDLQKGGMGYYNTLEQNCWILDGEGRNTSTTTQADSNGYVSKNICDNNGDFPDGNNPTLRINIDRSDFSGSFPAIPGITIVWGDYSNTDRTDEYATHYTVQLFKKDVGGVIVGGVIYEEESTSAETVFNSLNPNDSANFTNYYAIEISVQSWSLPHRRAKISKVYLGEVVVYGKDEIMSFTSTQEAERYGTALSKSEITFSVDNSNRKFDPLNPNGWFRYLARRQCVTVRYGFKIGDTIEWINNGGTYFLSEWEAPQNSIEATFTARDVFEFLTDIYDEGTYSETAVPLTSLASTLLSKVNIPQMRFVIERNILNSGKWGVYALEGTRAPLPVASIAECLQLIGNFASCQIYQNRDGRITSYFEPDYNVYSTDYIVNNENCYSAPRITLDKEISRVDTNTYNYTPDSEAGEVYNGTVNLVNGTQDIVLSYSSPIAVDSSNTIDIIISSPTGVTVMINEDKKFSYVRKLNVTVSGITSASKVTMVVMGKKLNVSKTVVTYPKNVTNDGEVLTADNELITNYSGAFHLGESIYGEHSRRMLVSAEFRADPRLDVLDGIKFENDRYDTNMYVRTTSVKLTYNGAFRGEIEGRQAR